MNTYLFTWNPNKWKWNNFENGIQKLKNTDSLIEQWSCISHRKIRIGDRIFLATVKEEPKGIIGSGHVISEPFLSPHWNGDPDAPYLYRVLIEFDILLNPKKDSILTHKILESVTLNHKAWTPRGSGNQINIDLADKLEHIWIEFLKETSNTYLPIKRNNKKNTYAEGAASQVTLTRYERNPKARKDCLDYYGVSCQVCKINFEETYGEIGRGFIHVHHLEQISKYGTTRQINPIEDLRPVCPNCHAMIHRKSNPYTIEEIKNFLKS